MKKTKTKDLFAGKIQYFFNHSYLLKKHTAISKFLSRIIILKLVIWFPVTYEISFYNPMENIWDKLEKSSKTGQDKKSLIPAFACFLTATAKV